MLLDVSERHATRDELARTEARFWATFEQGREGMLLLDNLHFVDVSDAALHLDTRPGGTRITSTLPLPG